MKNLVGVLIEYYPSLSLKAATCKVGGGGKLETCPNSLYNLLLLCFTFHRLHSCYSPLIARNPCKP